MGADFFDDDYDPLAPPAGGPIDAPAEDLGTGGVEGGGVVRLWFEDGKLTTVRVSTTWYDKLPPGQTLTQAFEEAFLLAAAQVAQDEEPERPDTSSITFDLPPFSARAVDAYAAMLHDHTRAWQAAIDELGALPAQPQPARGEHVGAIVQLNRAGHPERIMFDEEWLDNAQVGQICSAVLGATQKAYAAHIPSEDTRQRTLDRFRMEHEVLMTGFRRLLDPRREEHA